MDHDLTIMIYGAIMGVAGSIISSLISTIFQFWLVRREEERKQSQQLRHIHLPTDEEVIIINSRHSNENEPEAQRKTVEAGSLVLSGFASGILVYKTNDPMLGFMYSALLGFLLTNRAIKSIRS